VGRSFLSSLALASLLLAPAAHAQVAASFDYRVNRTISEGDGAYQGWSDQLTASGHYDVVPTDAAVSVHATYAWHYASPEDARDGSEDRTVEIDRAQRHYVAGSDLDEYDDVDARSLATWIYVPTTLRVGDEVTILDEVFLVSAVDEPLSVAGATRTTLHVQRQGTGRRNDAYGLFTTTTNDAYWFDAATGMFLRELRFEHDEGVSTDAERASFRQREEVAITDASYAPRVGPLPPEPQRIVQPFARFSWLIAPVGFSLAVVLGFMLVRRVLRPAAVRTHRGQEITVDDLGPGAALPAGATGTTIYFGAFLPHFLAVARRTSNRVWIARTGGSVVGCAIEDRVAGVPTIFAPVSDVCEALRMAMHSSDFFSELRHGNLESVMAATQRTGTKLPAATAYNVLETYEVLERTDGEEPVYDAQVVTRLEEPDHGAAAELLTRVLGVRCGDYLSASLAEGDLAYVARVDGVVVGVGLATVAGIDGRLHTLAVDPSHRNRGLGRELVRARVRAMMALGAKRIVTEIAARNSASLENVRREGFTTIGSMYIETSREIAPPATTPAVRR